MSVPLPALHRTVAHSYMQLLNYLPFEEQIQLRSTAHSAGKVPLRRLARLVAAKARSCLKVCIVPMWRACRSLMPFEQKAEEQNRPDIPGYDVPPIEEIFSLRLFVGVVMIVCYLILTRYKVFWALSLLKNSITV